MIASLLGLNKRRMVETPQGTFFLDPASQFGSNLMNGGYEPQMAEVLARHLQPGGVFIDLGANEGYFSVIASRLVGPAGAVIAVEPQSRLQPVIQTNLTANGCGNVQVIRCVVAEKTETRRLALAGSINTGSSSLFPQAKYSLPTEAVQSLSLSELLARAGVADCDLMKVDIEGAEYDVFMTAGDVLKSGVLRNIALEFHNSILDSRGLSGADLHRHILANGYELDDSQGHWVYSFRG